MDELKRKLAALESISSARERVGEFIHVGHRVRCEGADYADRLNTFARARRAKARPEPLCLYVHVPLCSSKCMFCFCASQRMADTRDLDRYVDALVREVELVSEAFRGDVFETLYIGGGTPSLMKPEQMRRLLEALFERFDRAKRFHFTCEMAPHTVTAEKLDVVAAFGVNRISMGVQSFAPGVLAAVGRAHQRPEVVERAVRLVREAGIPALNLDLMTGLPGESDSSFSEGLEQALALQPESIVVYRFFGDVSALALYGTEFDEHDRLRRNRHFDMARRRLTKEDVAPPSLYSVNYFAHGGFDPVNRYAQLHQRGGASVVGLGYSAQSHLRGHFTASPADDLPTYCAKLESGCMPDMRVRDTSEETAMAFYASNVIEGEGLDATTFERVFHRPLHEAFAQELSYLQARGCIWTDERGTIRAKQDCEESRFLNASLFFPAADLERLAELLSTPSHSAAPAACAGPHPAVTDDHHAAVQLCRTCNLRCARCPWIAGFDGWKLADPAALGVLLGSRNPSSVHFVGGEPTLHPSLASLIRFAASRADQVGLWTNGRMFRYQGFAHRLRRAGLTDVVVTLYGSSAQAHDERTRVQGAFDDTTHGIRNIIREGGLRLAVRLPVIPETEADLVDMTRLVAHLGVRAVVLDALLDLPIDHALAARLHQVVSQHRLDVRFFRRRGHVGGESSCGVPGSGPRQGTFGA